MKKPKLTWSVLVAWEENGQSFELISKDKLTETQAIDYMIAMEKAYEGTGRTFSCCELLSQREFVRALTPNRFGEYE